MQKLLSRMLARYGVLVLIAVVLGGGIFQLLHISVFSKYGSPHAICYLADPKMIWLHVVSDSLIGAAYVCISLTLAYLVRKASKEIPFHWMFLAFGLFIVSCGFTHFMEVVVIWQPLYWLSGYIKVITAAASVATALALFPLVPKIFILIDSVKKTEARRLQIETLNHELEAFTSTVAHDLRAPLRSIAGMALLLREDYGDRLDATGRDYADRVVASAEKMDALIIDLLNYSRVGSEQLEMGSVDLDHIFEEAQGTLAREIQDTHASIGIARPLGRVRASETLLMQVVVNLLSNAMKFVAKGVQPNITVTTAFADDRVRLSVADNGIGIPKEHQERVFKVFERLSSAYPGTGVGLAIVEKALKRMGGELKLESEAGKGSTFIIALPKA